MKKYTLYHITVGSIGLAPMSHKEAQTMKRKMMNPLDWYHVEIFD